MPLKAIIVEDEVDIQIALEKMLQRYCEDIEVVAKVDRVSTALDAIRIHQPDIVFLDIELPEENGFALFNYISDPEFEVIFTTAYSQYAIQAFKLSATDYLLKPFDPEDLKTAVQNAHNRKKINVSQKKLQALRENLNSSQKKIILPTEEGFLFVELADILYLEAQGNYTLFYLESNEKVLVSKTLKVYSLILEELNFFRVSRSHLVNLNYIKGYNRAKRPSITMKNGQSIPLSIHQRERFLKAIGQID